MKVFLWTLIGITLLAAVLVVAQRGFLRYGGAGPALLPPPDDIADLIDTHSANSGTGEDEGTPKPGINDAGFPLALPEGFEISIFARGLVSPRDLRMVQDTLLASIPARGTVMALPDADRDGRADDAIPIITGLDKPHGIEVTCTGESCVLYVAETTRVSAFDYDSILLQATNRRTVASLPSGGRHSTRSLLFLPAPNEHELLISIGSSCDVCNEPDERHGTVQVLDTDTGELAPFATGLRNAVFMTSNPMSDAVWVTEMGRDNLGDDLPPDEINIIKRGNNYGWPICYGQNVHDTVFDKNTYVRNPCAEPLERVSEVDLPAHSAPLGLAFMPHAAWGSQFEGDLLVAFHGSWNRSIPTGYKIVRIGHTPDGYALTDFVTGWLTADGALGRPVDLEITENGDAFISDDAAGVIYLLQQRH